MEEIQEQPALPQIEEIRAVNHHLRAAIDRVSDGVLIVEADPLQAPGPRVVFINHAGRRITGYKAEDILGQPIGMIYDPAKLNDFIVRLPAVARTGKTYQMQTVTTYADGTAKPLRWTVSAIRDGEGRALNYMITILAPREARPARPARPASAVFQPETTGESVDVDNDQIRASKMESLALVASGIAHDFNNILTTVIANLSLARLETSLGTELREHIDDATGACDSAKSLIQQLLAFARGEALVKKETHVGKLLNEAVSLATYGANVRCEVSIAEDLWSAEVDRTQITQVLSNLLINGRQAMPNGGVIQATAENRVVAEEDGLNVAPGQFIVLTVRDRGCGIPERQLTRIFDPFFTTKKQGSGLGLATSYSLVQKHNGTILVRSKEDVGTEFKIYLPATGRVCAADVAQAEEHLITGEGCILVVDDQESVRTVAAAILRKLGYEAITANGGREAVDIYNERKLAGDPVSAVLMDITLPGGLSGEDTFDELRRFDPEIRSIATSGYFDGDSHERFIDCGFAGLLPKPYTAETLSKILHDVMRGDKHARIRGPKDAGSGVGDFVPAD